MSFLIADAMAAPAGEASSSGPANIIFLVVLFVVFYFLLIRPQSKRAKEHRNMVGALAKGDEIVTNGGTLGRISGVGEQFITVEIADGIEIKVQRSAVQTVMPKGTIKTA
ncbi:MAG: preprotein translocase subunit YajC [Acidiferrobacterales bacterium]